MHLKNSKNPNGYFSAKYRIIDEKNELRFVFLDFLKNHLLRMNQFSFQENCEQFSEPLKVISLTISSFIGIARQQLSID